MKKKVNKAAQVARRNQVVRTLIIEGCSKHAGRHGKTTKASRRKETMKFQRELSSY